MAFTNTPSLSTYDTKRIGFISNPTQRNLDSNQDFRLINLMTDEVASPLGGDKKQTIKNRPGIKPAYYTPPSDQQEGRGIYLWETRSILVTVIGFRVYFNDVASDLLLASSTGPVGMVEHINQDAVDTLCLFDGVNGYVFSSPTEWKPIIPVAWLGSGVHYDVGQSASPLPANGFVYDVIVAGTPGATQPVWPTTEGATVVDGTVTWQAREFAFPSPHVPQPVFLDGYLFLPKKDTADVYNSDLNEPSHWAPGNYLTAEMYPGQVVALTKNNNYIYAVGTNSIQYFYDNANPTGTPLANNAGAILQFGCPAPTSVVQTDKEVILVGSTNAGGYTVWLIDGFKAKEISIPSVCVVLDQEGSNIINAKGSSVRVSGQKLYILVLTNRTLVYSFTTDMWSEWLGPTGNFQAWYATDGVGGSSFWVDKDNGTIYSMKEDYYLDNGVPYTCTLITNKYDFESINRKFMSRFSIIGDTPSYSGVYQTVNISWSDDDYFTWNTPVQLIMNGDLPCIRQLGNFRRRAFKLEYSWPFLFRMDGFEVDINKGSQ